MIARQLEESIRKHLGKKKTVIIYGARQVGKTTLLNRIIAKHKAKTLILNGDDADVRALFSEFISSKLKPIIGDHKLIIIDEAQRIPNTGLALKIIHDNFPAVQLIATGSSSFELANKIQEPMTGRKFEFFLSPLSFGEMSDHHGYLEEKRMLDTRLVYGYYPDIVMNPGMEVALLKPLVSSYLYKDILMLENVHKPVLVDHLLKLLALQIGNEVSYNELSKTLGSDKGTIEKYIDLLEKSYIIFRLPALSRNLRSEVKKTKKIYFYDNGVRNTLIGNFLPLEARTDLGALWENFVISERKKFLINHGIDTAQYFWRTVQQQEIDYIEEHGAKLAAYEFKWNARKSVNVTKTFSNAYPGSSFKVITPEQLSEFLF